MSRITTGKKQTITLNKTKKQKRFLSDTLKDLHLKFVSEQRSISYSLFCSLRPFWVVVPTLSDRDTCMCKMHENLVFIVQKLHQLKVINTTNLDELVKSITCDPESKKCMYSDCSDCKDLCVPVSRPYGTESEATYLQWAIVDKEHKADPTKTSKVTMKKEFRATNIKNQYIHYRALKNGLKAHECLIHVDFS